jgi:Tfp pilus assembly protein FimT
VTNHHGAPASRKRATTLVELIVVVAVIGIATGFVLPPLKRGYDRLESRSAAHEAISAFFVARAAAIGQARPVAVDIDEDLARIVVVAGFDTILVVAPGRRHGVALTTTRPSMTYTTNGLGYGGANLRIILARGAAAETVLVSREGRVKLGARGR